MTKKHAHTKRRQPPATGTPPARTRLCVCCRTHTTSRPSEATWRVRSVWLKRPESAFNNSGRPPAFLPGPAGHLSAPLTLAPRRWRVRQGGCNPGRQQRHFGGGPPRPQQHTAERALQLLVTHDGLQERRGERVHPSVECVCVFLLCFLY